MAVAQEETFGPLAPIIRFDDGDKVVREANDTNYGLAAYFFASNFKRGVAEPWKLAWWASILVACPRKPRLLKGSVKALPILMKTGSSASSSSSTTGTSVSAKPSAGDYACAPEALKLTLINAVASARMINGLNVPEAAR